ncbi:Uncharacterised protein r2_g2914 [Pycnogonum litorale]
MAFVKKAWTTVTEVAIQNCFKKAKFIQEAYEEEVKELEETDEEAKGIWERLQAAGLVPNTLGFMEFAETDTQLVTRETITEEGILEEIQEKAAEENDKEKDDTEEDEDKADPDPPPSTMEALAMVKQLQRYVLCQDDSEEISAPLSNVYSYLINKSLAKKKQSTILNFFRKQ